MGNSVSHVFKSDQSTFEPPVKVSANSSIEELTAVFTKLLEYHQLLDEAVQFANRRVTEFVHPINAKKDIVEAFAENRGLRDNSSLQKNTQLLFDLGVLKVKVNDNTTFKVVIHPHFTQVHKQLVANINTLLATKPVTSEFSLNTVSDAKIKSQFENNLKTINKVVARIMIYKYHIIFNNYIMHLYAIYAQSQVEVFEAQLVRKKKQSEFVALEKMLNEALKKASKEGDEVNIQTSLNSLHSALDIGKAKFGGGSRAATGGNRMHKGGVGADVLATTQYITTITTLLEKYKVMFEESKAQTEEFFVFINRILDAKTYEIVEKYADMSNSTIINKNIISALKTLEAKINTNQVSKNAGNIEYFMSNLKLAPEEDQVLRQYLQMYSLQSNAASFSSGLQQGAYPSSMM